MASEIITLRDDVSGAAARVAPGLGFNCFQFRAVVAERPLEVLWSEKGFEDGQGRPSGSGIPLLFPFAGRIRGTSFEWEGKRFALEAGDGRGNAIHGFAYTRPWRVVDQSANRVVGEFQASRDDATLLDCWPADFRITAAYELAATCLALEVTVENPDSRVLPFGFGAHPYFRVPLGGDDPRACRLRVPVSRHWPLDNMVPIGESEPSEAADRLRTGVALGEEKFDDVFGGLLGPGGLQGAERYEAEVVDAGAGRRVRIVFDRSFFACVVYTPPHREAVCIEPYSCLPDPFRMSSQGFESGLRVLGPAERWTARIEMHVEPKSEDCWP